MTNKQRRSIVDDAKSKGYQGSYIDLFKQAVLNPSQNQDVLTADTPLEKEQGLRPLHEAGRTDASMAFKDVPPNTPFNTVGMKAPIDIKKFDEQGHLVKSYDAVPPGIQSLDTGPNKGTVLETPARMQEGGFFDNVPYDKRGPRQEIVEPYFTGDDYNYRKALESGETPSPEDGHWGSVAGDGSNVVLKSKDHPTIKHEFIPTMMDPDWKMVGDPEGFFGEDNSMKYVPRMQKGDYVTPMRKKEFPSNAKRAEMVNYAKEIDMAGRLNKIGANTTNEELGRGSADRGTLPLVPNPGLEKAMSNKRIKAQEGSMISDFLLPALSSNNAVKFGNQQADSQAKLVTKSEQDLAAEQANVQRVRENVIPSAKNIANRWANMTDEERKSYEDILDYAPNSSATGRKPPTNGMTRGQQTSEVRRKLADRPESLKEYMPNYNIFLDQPDKFGTNRGVYCTTMGCYAYEKAGARQITDKNGHPMRGNTQFVNATKQGVSGFEQIDAKDRQPGDLTVLRGNARSDYNDPTSVVTRDHHTVIYAGEGKREEDAKSMARGAWDWITGAPKKEYNYNNPEAIKAYSAEGGNMDTFQLATRNNENPADGDAFKFYRYVGQTPQMQGRVGEAKSRQQMADQVAAALNEQAKRSSKMQEEERPDAPDSIEPKGPIQIDNPLPEQGIANMPKQTSTEKTPRQKAEDVENRIKGKVNELKDRRNNKKPKEPKPAKSPKEKKTPSNAKLIRQQYAAKIKAARKGQ